jgi:polyhydroxyalkanoate synthesis regulator protein
MSDSPTTDEFTPSAAASGERPLGSQTGRIEQGGAGKSSGLLLLLVGLSAAFGLVAAGVSTVAVLTLKKTDATAIDQRSAIFTEVQKSGLAITALSTDQKAQLKNIIEAQATAASALGKDLEAIAESQKHLAEDTAKAVQPVLSNIGIAVTDKLSEDLGKSAAERKQMAADLAAIAKQVAASAERMAVLETAVKAVTAQSDETRMSVAAANARVVEALTNKRAPSDASAPTGDDVRRLLDEIRAGQADLGAQIKAMSAKLNRGL